MEHSRLDLQRILEGLVTMAVGTRDEALVPACELGVGAMPDPASNRLTIYLAETHCQRTLANLRKNGLVAVALDRPTTHRAVQMKGRCVGIRPAEPSERAIVEQGFGCFLEQVALVGAPTPLVRRLNRWPCQAVTIEVDEVFEQTPGPRAGLPFSHEGAA